MHDGIALEQRGKAAAVVCTEPFVPTARAISQAQGMASYPLAVVPHPITALDDEGLRERARMALPQVLELLLQGTP